MNIFYPTLNQMYGRTATQEGVRARDGETVQLLQPPKERLRMATVMEQFFDVYQTAPKSFPMTPGVVIGNDHKVYTTKSIMRDLKKYLQGWKDEKSNNHIYKSFVDRHNYLVDWIARDLVRQGYNQDAQLLIDTYYINFYLGQIIPHYMPTNGLFETK